MCPHPIQKGTPMTNNPNNDPKKKNPDLDPTQKPTELPDYVKNQGQQAGQKQGQDQARKQPPAGASSQPPGAKPHDEKRYNRDIEREASMPPDREKRDNTYQQNKQQPK